MYDYLDLTDLAGDVCFRPSFWQTKTRIHNLIDKYLSIELLCDRLEDLPEQFINPQPRPWQPIQWDTLNSEQIIDIDLEVFLKIIKGALDTEAPIRGYTQASRQYLQAIHPAMARFVGGTIAEDNSVIELGLWEKEERQHTPALAKIYQQLTQQKVIVTPPNPKADQSSDRPDRDLYRHGMHRIATEYSAVCLYLWLMSKTTGSLQQVLQELLQDEINHLSKFWGFGKWLYRDSYLHSLSTIIGDRRHLKETNRIEAMKHFTATINRMMKVLHWDSWTINRRIELIYTFISVAKRMNAWSKNLTSEYLSVLFTASLLADDKSSIFLISA